MNATLRHWVPRAGEVVTYRKNGHEVEIMHVASYGISIRPVRGGLEKEVPLTDLIPPDDAPGGFEDWQASRG
ncbi:hypothetical protein [Kitasatospora sp. NPDC002040]|uniref:hypothetical protein n=1 Tax=Kitasatospora sp. NPDC002040 TaxID=3154661 RepID=UPI00333474A6